MGISVSQLASIIGLRFPSDVHEVFQAKTEVLIHKTRRDPRTYQLIQGTTKIEVSVHGMKWDWGIQGQAKTEAFQPSDDGSCA